MNYKSFDKLTEEIAEVCEGLVYISETDSPITVYRGGDEKIDREYAAAVKKKDTDYRKGEIEVLGHNSLLDRLTAKQEWHTPEQRQRARKFEKLRKLLETNLTDIRQIRKGRVRVDIYIVGTDAGNNIVGVKTCSVET